MDINHTIKKKAAPKAANENAGMTVTSPSLQDVVKPFEPVLEMRPVGELKPNARKARIHPDKQVAQIAASITTFGLLVPIVVDEEGTILAGHGRYLAARLLDRATVPPC